MTDISKALALELAETWETMAELVGENQLDRRATLRECASALHRLASGSDRRPKVSDKMICIGAESTLLVNGCEYTVIDCVGDLVEMKQCPGMLFSPQRFRHSPDQAQGKEPQS